MYNVKSLNAEEFINHEEILESLEYAEKNKSNTALLNEILEKAEQRKGLTHREAAVLLECDNEEINQKIYKLAEQIKKDFYGNRIVMFAPLYLSNYCINGCVYCPYHKKNCHIKRKKLTQEEIKREVIALQDMGHKRLAIEAGEDPVNNPIEYILDSIKTIYSIKHKNGAIRRVNVNIAATTVENYRNRLYQKLKEILESAEIDQQRIVTEAAIFADKVAVDEETVRLKSHISQLDELLESDGAIGRKLDFIVQEMNREVNTIGSKAQDIEITKLVVEMKSEIEKIREQIQNIE